MAARILPIRTSDRVQLELAPVDDGHEWKACKRAGDYITAVVRPLSRVEVQEVTAIEEHRERIAKIVALGFVSASFEGQPVSADELPYLHWQSLGGAIFSMSVTGADPFGQAAAKSQP